MTPGITRVACKGEAWNWSGWLCRPDGRRRSDGCHRSGRRWFWTGFGVSGDGTVARPLEGAPAGLRVRSGLARRRRAAPTARGFRCGDVLRRRPEASAPRDPSLPLRPACAIAKGATSGRVQSFPKRGKRRPSPPRPLCSLPLAGVVSWRASTFSMGGAVVLADRWMFGGEDRNRGCRFVPIDGDEARASPPRKPGNALGAAGQAQRGPLQGGAADRRGRCA